MITEQQQMQNEFSESDQDMQQIDGTSTSSDENSLRLSPRRLGGATVKEGENCDSDEDYETAIIISTHLIPSHPSLDILNETMKSLNYLNGLSPNTQIIITVDGLREDNAKNRRDYQLLMSNKHKEKLESYLVALYKAYSRHTNVKIVVSGTHIHLARNIMKAIDLLDPRTEYVYILQQDLPFIRKINHTAIIKTIREYPDVVRLIRFNNRENRVLRNTRCWNQTDAVQSVNGINLHKTSHYSDMNLFTSLDFFRNHILTVVDLDDYPEATMMRLASRNCSFYGPHLYGKPGEHAYIKHTDGGELKKKRRVLA